MSQVIFLDSQIRARLEPIATGANRILDAQHCTL